MRRTMIGLAAMALIIAGCDDNATKNNQAAPDTNVADAADVAVSDADQPSDADDTDLDAETDVEDVSDATPEDATDTVQDADADEDGCLQVQIGSTVTETYGDSVSIEYSTEATPRVEGEVRMLSVLFEKYNDTEYVGEFELGPGTVDENFGSCHHCVYMLSLIHI